MRPAALGRTLFLWWLALALAAGPLLAYPLVSGAGFHDNQRLIQMSCALLALAVIAGEVALGRSLPLLFSRPGAFLLALFFFFGLSSAVTAFSPRHALFEWANFILLLGIAWLIAVEVGKQGDSTLDGLLLAAGMACALYFLLEMAIYIALLKARAQPSPFDLIVGYANYRFFNHVQTSSLPLLGLLAARMPDRGRRRFWWGVTALWWMLLYVGVGRGTLMGLAAGLLLAWATLGETAARWCREQLQAALVGLIAYLLLYVAIPLAHGLKPFGLFFSVVERSVASPTSGRLALWERALEMGAAHPWLGAGPAHFAHYGRDIPNGAAHPHNWLLQIGSEWGIPALILLVSLLAHLMRRLGQLRRHIATQEQTALAAWLVGAWAIVVDGLVSGLIVMPMSQLWIAFFVGCCWGWCVRVGAPLEYRSLRRDLVRWVLSLAVAIGLAYVLVQGVWPDLKMRIGRMDVINVGPPRILFNGAF